MELVFSFTPDMILEAKKEAVEKAVKEYNEQHSYKDSTGNLRNSIAWYEEKGVIYIMRGTEIITTI